MPFQSVVNNQPAPGVAGDFASTNPFSSVLAGPGALVAPAGGLIVGNFCWIGPAGQVSQSFVSGYTLGFVGRNEQALITQFLGESTLVIPAGFMVNAFNGGDFWAKFNGGAAVGATVYADKTNGAVLGATSAAASVTGIIGTTADVQGSIAAPAAGALAVFTLATVSTSGKVMPGDVLNIPGAGLVEIVAQLTGTTGGSNGATYSTNSEVAVGAFTTAQVVQSSFINVSAVGSGTLVPGETLISALLQPNTELGAQVTGSAGAAGIYNVSPRQGNIASGTITTAADVATGFTVTGAYAPAGGEVGKISAAVA
jgi:hypothetical protein